MSKNQDSNYAKSDISDTSSKTDFYKRVDGKKCCQAAVGKNKDVVVKKTKTFPLRYVKKEVLGREAFGVVTKAYDKVSCCFVAIKVIQSYYYQSKALVEVEHLWLLNEADVLDDKHIVRLKDVFIYKSQIHLVFELMGLDLGKRMKLEYFGGFSLNETIHYARQICTALNFLSRPEIRLIHGDLKPDNILLSCVTDKTVKIADFGLSCRRDICNQIIQSLYYRAPEILLGLPYTIAVDMWSFACIIVELHTNEPLFKGSTPDEVVGKMVEVLGIPPKELLNRAPKCFKYFDINPTTGMYCLKDKTIVPGSKKLADIVGAECGGPGGKWRGKIGHAPATYKVVLNFLSDILNYMPEERLTPENALNRNFFKLAEGVLPQPTPT